MPKPAGDTSMPAPRARSSAQRSEDVAAIAPSVPPETVNEKAERQREQAAARTALCRAKKKAVASGKPPEAALQANAKGLTLYHSVQCKVLEQVMKQCVGAARSGSLQEWSRGVLEDGTLHNARLCAMRKWLTALLQACAETPVAQSTAREGGDRDIRNVCTDCEDDGQKQQLCDPLLHASALRSAPAWAAASSGAQQQQRANTSALNSQLRDAQQALQGTQYLLHKVAAQLPQGNPLRMSVLKALEAPCT